MPVDADGVRHDSRLRLSTTKALAPRSSGLAAEVGDADVQRRLATAYIDPMPMSVTELTAWLTHEHERLGKLIRELGIKADGGA